MLGQVSGERRAGPALQTPRATLSLAAEIVFLRAVTPLYPANQADIIFDITEGNFRDSFDIVKRYEDSMTVGECPSTEPKAWAKGHVICTGGGGGGGDNLSASSPLPSESPSQLQFSRF